ncbi:MAG: hypothetical protein FJZ57_05060 [Chlamydiae bacterium]|nr:hypothetical protein [Chlamydiota bacterium]
MINRFDIFSYSVPLAIQGEPKQGFLVKVTDNQGKSQWAEASPLPGWSNESLCQVENQLLTICEHLIGSCSSKALQYLLNTDNLLPSVSCGLFCAIYGLSHPKTNFPYEVSGLLYGNYEQILSQLKDLESKGFRYVKLKTSKLTIPQSHNLIEQLSKKYKLRLDINRGWTCKETNDFLSSYPINFFDYIEEPYADIKMINSCRFPLALDESLREMVHKELVVPSTIKAIVFKPMLMGIGPKSQAIIHHALKNQLKISFSSSFETGVGLCQIPLFVDFFNIKKTTLGIDTYKFMPNDLLTERHYIKDGKAFFSEINPNLEFLKKVRSVY